MKNYPVTLQWIYFPLHPDTPEEGRSLEDLFRGLSSQEIAGKQAQMKHLMAQEGLPYGARTMTYNSRLAQELAKWADSQPNSQAMHAQLYEAYFVAGKNIGKLQELLQVTQAAGFSVEAARDVLENRRFQDAVNEDWNLAHQFGVTGVPTFVAGQYQVVGAQPYSVLEKLIHLSQTP